MIQAAEAVRDVPLYEPSRTAPLTLDLRERGVAPTTRPETVRSVAELRLVIRLQDEADHLLHQLVRPRRDTERAQLVRAWFLDVDAPGRPPPVAFVTQSARDRLDLGQRHPIGGFSSRAWGESTIVAVDLLVGGEVQLGVEQESVDALQGQSPPAPLADDAQDRFGFTHLAHLPLLKHQ